MQEITVELLRNGVVIKTTRTNPGGEFSFAQVPQGLYEVRASQKELVPASVRVVVNDQPVPSLVLSIGVPSATADSPRARSPMPPPPPAAPAPVGGRLEGLAGGDTAASNFAEGGVNRVILATDGDFNVGVTSQGALIRLIERERERGIFLSVLGVGTGNLKDSTMEKLADKGNGKHAARSLIDCGQA